VRRSRSCRSSLEALLDRPRLLAPDRDGLAVAAEALRAGRLVAFPTETVYGLGAAALDPAAVARIFAAKGRPGDNPLIVHLAAADALDRVVSRITPLARRLAAAFWPGPLTLVLDAAPVVPRITTGGLTTVAVRVPDHPVATALLAAADLPVAAPSANRSGRPSPTTAAHVVADLGVEVDVVLDGGPCPVGVESTVVDVRGDRPVVLRDGTITREQLGLEGTGPTPPAVAAASPGTRYRHYAPRCAIVLVPAGQGRERTAALAAAGTRVGLVGSTPAPAGVVSIARVRDVTDLAQRLYAALRDAEDAEVDVLVVEAVPEVGLGRAVMDRLRRAAS
jgi:L-threonylcarbamoyladenylate synthase